MRIFAERPKAVEAYQFLPEIDERGRALRKDLNRRELRSLNPQWKATESGYSQSSECIELWDAHEKKVVELYPTHWVVIRLRGDFEAPEIEIYSPEAFEIQYQEITTHE